MPTKLDSDLTASSFTRATAMSPPTFMSKGMIRSQKSGSTRRGCKAVAGFLGWRSIGF